jgi:hypothetical protein
MHPFYRYCRDIYSHIGIHMQRNNELVMMEIYMVELKVMLIFVALNGGRGPKNVL